MYKVSLNRFFGQPPTRAFGDKPLRTVLEAIFLRAFFNYEKARKVLLSGTARALPIEPPKMVTLRLSCKQVTAEF